MGQTSGFVSSVRPRRCFQNKNKRGTKRRGLLDTNTKTYARDEALLEGVLNHAMQGPRGSFQQHYQPQIDGSSFFMEGGGMPQQQMAPREQQGNGGAFPYEQERPASPPGNFDGSKRQLTCKVRAMVEVNDKLFEVSLIGNSMLPTTKRADELSMLVKKLPPADTMGLAAELARCQSPQQTASRFEEFVNRALASSLHQRNDAFKSFLGLHLAYNTDHFRANPDGSVTRGRPPFRPQNGGSDGNSSMYSTVDVKNQQQQQPLVPPCASANAENVADADAGASAAEKAAALELIRQRRATKMNEQRVAAAVAAAAAALAPPVVAAPAVESHVVCDDVIEVPAQSSQSVEAAFSIEGYRSTLGSTVEAGSDGLAAPSTPERPTRSIKGLEGESTTPMEAQTPPVPKRALKQAEAIMSQVDLKTELRTWVSGADENGCTFTQSLCGGGVTDIVDTPLSARGILNLQMSDESDVKSSGAAPAPMEASTSTSSRVMAISGYTSSFRDIKRKFQAADAAKVTDQEYESSLSDAPTAAPFQEKGTLSLDAFENRAADEQSAVKPNNGVFDALVRTIKGRKGGVGGHEEDQVKAATALCNLCCDSAQNREIARQCGAVEALIQLLRGAGGAHKARTIECAAACFSNLSGDRQCKAAIAASDAPSLLKQALSSGNLQAASQAAGALWTLCIDSSEQTKTEIATADTVQSLVNLLADQVEATAGLSHAQRMSLLSRVCGCLSECSIRNNTVKSYIGNAGAIPQLLKVCESEEMACQRLAACALCNLLANHQGNKRLAKRANVIREMAGVLKSTQVKEMQCACASVIINIACKSDKEELEALQVLPLLRSIKNSRGIDVRLMCVTNSVGESQSLAFGTY